MCYLLMNAKRTALGPFRFESKEAIVKAHRICGNKVLPSYGQRTRGRLP